MLEPPPANSAPAATRHVDLAVLGDSLGGLVGAALAAKAGLRVVVVAAPRARLPSWQRAASLASQRSAVVRRACERLGIAHGRSPRPAALPARHVVVPERRLWAPYGEAAALQALGAAWPAEQAALAEVFARLGRHNEALQAFAREERAFPPAGGWKDWALSLRLGPMRRYAEPFDGPTQEALLGALRPAHPARRALLAPLGLSPTGPAPSFFAAVRSLSTFWREEPLCLGTAERPWDALWHALAMAGGEVWTTQTTRVQLPRRRRPAEIWTAAAARPLSAGAVWLNGAADDTSMQALGLAAPEAEEGDVRSFAVFADGGRLPVGCAGRMWLEQRAPAGTWALDRLARAAEADGQEPQLWARWHGTALSAAEAEASLRQAMAAAMPYVADDCRLLAVDAGRCAEAPGPRTGGTLGLQKMAMRVERSHALRTDDSVLPALGVEGGFWLGWRAAAATLGRAGRACPTPQRRL